MGLIEFVKCVGCVYQTGNSPDFQFTEMVKCSVCGETLCLDCDYTYWTDTGWKCVACESGDIEE